MCIRDSLTSCIATKEVVDEDATLKAVEAGELQQEVLPDALKAVSYTHLTTVAKVKELAERRYLPEDRAWEIPAHELARSNCRSSA